MDDTINRVREVIDAVDTHIAGGCACRDKSRTVEHDLAPELLALWEVTAEVLAVNHSPFLGSDGSRPCQCAVHESARARLAALEARAEEEL